MITIRIIILGEVTLKTQVIARKCRETVTSKAGIVELRLFQDN